MTVPPSKQTNSTRGKLANRLALRRAAKARRNAREARRNGAPHTKVTLRGKLANRLALRRAAKERQQARAARKSRQDGQSMQTVDRPTEAVSTGPAGASSAAADPAGNDTNEAADTSTTSGESTDSRVDETPTAASTTTAPTAAASMAAATSGSTAAPAPAPVASTEPASAPKRSLGRTALNVVGIVLLLALVVPFAVYAVPDLAGADESYVVLTGSMTPAIAPGDVVIVDSVAPTAIGVGDVITYTRSPNNPPVTHRVIEVVDTESGPAFVTKGDANEDPDTSIVYPTQVIGRVLVTFPYIGHVIEFGNSTNGFLLLVVTPFALLILTEIAAFVRSGRGDEDEEAVATAAAASVAAETAAPTETSQTDEAEGFVLTVNDLNLALLSLGLFAGYAAYIAFTYRGTLTLGVAVGTVTAFLLGVGVRLFGFRSSEPEQATAATDGGVDEGGEQ